jgi:ABC-type transport system substrate-binding protein
MEQIDSALRAAKWHFNPAGTIQYNNKAGLITAYGVSVHIDKADNPKLVPAAEALGTALRDAGIPIQTIYVDDPGYYQGMTAGRIHVWIGSKPLD